MLFGEPWHTARYRTGDRSIRVFAWTPEQTGQGVYIFATLGAHAGVGNPDQGCEFFFGLTSCPEGLPDSLAEVALDGNGTDRIPQSGDTITLAFDLWQGTRARAYMFTDGGDEIIPPLEIGELRLDFIQLVPLFSEEVDFKTRRGEAALWQAFERVQLPYWDASRSPLRAAGAREPGA